MFSIVNYYTPASGLRILAINRMKLNRPLDIRVPTCEIILIGRSSVTAMLDGALYTV